MPLQRSEFLLLEILYVMMCVLYIIMTFEKIWRKKKMIYISLQKYGERKKWSIFTKIWRKKKMIYLLLLFWVHSVRTKNNISESACNYDFFQSYHDLFSENSGGLIEYANPTAPTCYFLINSYVSLLKSLIYVVYMK